MKKILIIFNLIFVPTYAWSEVVWVGETLDGRSCQIKSGFGPFDYLKRVEKDRTPRNPLYLVEVAHFTPEVENLIRGESSDIEGDIDYTLRAWPNHHRALLSMIKYQINIKNKIMPGKLRTPPECYLQRAIKFSPNDGAVYSLYGYYLRKMGHLQDAVKYYDKSLELDPENAKFAYSYSLLLIDLKKYDAAVKYAKIAYKKGNAPGGLMRKLKKLGVWTE